MSDLLGQCGYCGSFLYSGDRNCPQCGAGFHLPETEKSYGTRSWYGVSSAPTDGFWEKEEEWVEAGPKEKWVWGAGETGNYSDAIKASYERRLREEGIWDEA